MSTIRLIIDRDKKLALLELMEAIRNEDTIEVTDICDDVFAVMKSINDEKSDSLLIELLINKISCTQNDDERLLRQKEKNLKNELDITKDTLHRLGYDPTRKGFLYLQQAILLSIHEDEYLQLLSKHLYPKIAKQFHTSGPSAEKAIRDIINTNWVQYGGEKLQSLFKYRQFSQKPTNRLIIKLLTSYVKDKLAVT